MCAPDPALQEDAQSITKLAHILRKVLLHRKGIEQEGPAPPTNNERKIQSTLAIWGFGEEDKVFQLSCCFRVV